MRGIIRFYPLEMEEWVGCCDLIVMRLRDSKMIIKMDFLIQAKVSIMAYLRTLAFMEKGTPCTVMVVVDHAIETEIRARLDSSTKHSGGWLEEKDSGLVEPWKSLGLGQGHMAYDSPQFESTRKSTSVGGGGFVTPFDT